MRARRAESRQRRERALTRRRSDSHARTRTYSARLPSACALCTATAHSQRRTRRRSRTPCETLSLHDTHVVPAARSCGGSGGSSCRTRAKGNAEQYADCIAGAGGAREQQQEAVSWRSTRRPPNPHPHPVVLHPIACISHPVPFCLLVISGLHPRARGIIAYCARGSASAARGSASDIATRGSATAGSL